MHSRQTLRASASAKILVALVALAASVLAASVADAATYVPVRLRTHTGQAEHDLLGTDVAAVGDVDGDGVADYAAGVPGHQDRLGRVVVYSGADGSVLVSATLSGVTPPVGPALGSAIAGAGDLTGDGVPEVLAGAPGVFHSRAHLVSGATSAPVLSFGPGPLPLGYGTSVAATDADGDGDVDLIVTDPGCFDTAQFLDTTGCVNVFDGPTGAALVTHRGPPIGLPSAPWDYGRTVAALGDLNGDGRGDYGIGIPKGPSGFGYDGRFEVRDRFGVHLTVLAPGAGISRGAAAGDVDLDGEPELAIPGTGALWLVTADGPSAGTTRWSLPYPGGTIGTGDAARAVAGIGDFDANGVPDLALGDVHLDGAVGTDTGGWHVLDGDTGTIRYTVEGDGPDDHMGAAIAHLGDLNGDGHPEILVGAPGYDGGIVAEHLVPARDIGAAYLYTLVPPCVDQDGDGWGAGGGYACPAGPEPDCDDANPAVSPGATEIPGNGVDDDCDPSTPAGGCTPARVAGADAPLPKVAPAGATMVLTLVTALAGVRRRRTRT